MRERILFVVWILSGFCQGNGPFSGENYAKNKPAHQEPSTLEPYTADLAVDGDTSWPACTHTYGAYNEPSSWTVELEKLINVTGIIIYNRGINIGTDFNYRLQNFCIYGLSPLTKDVIYNDTNNNSYVQNVIRLEMFNSRAYTAIEIWIPARNTHLDEGKQNVLTLCEVEVYGVSECEIPNLDSHVQIVSRPNESYIILTCEPGYTATENTTITCNNFVWGGPQPKCNPIRCESPGEVDHGYYLVSDETMCNSRNITNLFFPCKIKAVCNEGYLLKDQSERSCQADGQWTSVYPICDIVTCDFPGEFFNGKYIIDTNNNKSYVSGSLNYTTKIEVQCDTGYKMENSTQRICESNGTWSGGDPYCSIVHCSLKVKNYSKRSLYPEWRN